MKRLLTIAFFCAIAIFSSHTNAGEDITLRFSWWGGAARHESTLKAIQLFEKENPGVTIKGEYMGWPGYLERLTNQIGGGAEPDIIQMDWAWLALFSKNGDGFYNMLSKPGLINTNAYDQKWLDQAMIKGKLNGLPVSFTTQYFVWNKTIFDKAGVPIPTTWDELVQAGLAFQERLGDDYYCLDTNHNQIVYLTHTWIFQKTGRMFINPQTNQLDLTEDELVDWLEFYKKLNDSHALVPLSVRASRSGDPDSPTQEHPDFVEGRWAGNYTWDSAIAISLSTPRKEFEFVLGEYLGQDGAKSSGRTGRPAQIIGVSKNSKNPEMATKFVNFLLTSPESAKLLGVTRGVLLAKPAYQALLDNGLITPMQQQAIDQIADVAVHAPSPYLENPRVLKLLRDVIESISYDKITAREGAQTLIREATIILNRLNR